MLKKRGIDALVNDSLVGIVLTTGAYIVGCGYLASPGGEVFADGPPVDSVDSALCIPLRKHTAPSSGIRLIVLGQLRYTEPAYNASGQYTAPVILFGALIGLNVGLAVSSAIVRI